MFTVTLQLLSLFQKKYNILVNLIKNRIQAVLMSLYEIKNTRVQGHYAAELISNRSEKPFVLI